MSTLTILQVVLAVIVVIDLGLRLAAKLRGRSIPWFLTVFSDAPKLADPRLNKTANVLENAGVPIAFVALLLGFVALYANYDAAGAVLVFAGGIGMNLRNFFLEWCLGFKELADDTSTA
jgi:hypothetical protein